MLSTLFRHFRCLRILTLDFKSGGTIWNLPDAVENFIHLRYLNLVNYCEDALPETICNLCNLQILKIIIDGNKFQKLPQGMSKLINQRHFNLSFRNNCLNVKFPRGFGRLTSIRTLYHFIVNGKDDSERCKLGELINLNHLKTLVISGLGSECYTFWRLMNTKACGFLVLVIEEFCVMEEGKECDVTTKSRGDEMINACFSFYEAEAFHGMEECKAGEATSSRFWKPYLEYKSDLFPTLKECKVEATSSRYEDITNTLDQFYLMGVDIAQEQLLWFMRVLLNGSRHSSRVAFVVYESTPLYKNFGEPLKTFVAAPPKIIDNVISSLSPTVIYD
ncbi:putative disease resistance protein rga3 [Quercus suber]|uniref:Disease resistance protein rga3 n=1 Tax=Quercus suber TaxID=58331 RepID=A0AAW0L100_QUESU